MNHTLATINITPGEHKIVWHAFGMTFYGDTIISTLIAGAIVILLGFFMRSRLNVRRPGRVQLFYETVTDQVQKQVEDSMGIKTAPWAVSLAFSLFLFILAANWLALIPTKEFIPPPTSDPNLTYALALLVIVTMHVAGIRRNGAKKYYAHIFEKPRVLAPLRIVEEIIKPVTLSLRLFGNIFAGTIMLALIAALPAFILWAPEVLWKLFDAFIGLIQAFIFGLLTILYLSSIKPHEQHAEQEGGGHGESGGHEEAAASRDAREPLQEVHS